MLNYYSEILKFRDYLFNKNHDFSQYNSLKKDYKIFFPEMTFCINDYVIPKECFLSDFIKNLTPNYYFEIFPAIIDDKNKKYDKVCNIFELIFKKIVVYNKINNEYLNFYKKFILRFYSNETHDFLINIFNKILYKLKIELNNKKTSFNLILHNIETICFAKNHFELCYHLKTIFVKINNETEYSADFYVRFSVKIVDFNLIPVSGCICFPKNEKNEKNSHLNSNKDLKLLKFVDSILKEIFDLNTYSDYNKFLFRDIDSNTPIGIKNRNLDLSYLKFN